MLEHVSGGRADDEDALGQQLVLLLLAFKPTSAGTVSALARA